MTQLRIVAAGLALAAGSLAAAGTEIPPATGGTVNLTPSPTPVATTNTAYSEPCWRSPVMGPDCVWNHTRPVAR